MLITQGIKNKTRNLARGSGLDSGDGGDCMTGVEELEEQVSAKGGRTPCGHPARSSKLLVQNRKTSNAGPSRSMSYSLRKFDFTNFQSNPASIRYEYRPLSICFCVLIFSPRSSLLYHDYGDIMEPHPDLRPCVAGWRWLPVFTVVRAAATGFDPI